MKKNDLNEALKKINDLKNRIKSLNDKGYNPSNKISDNIIILKNDLKKELYSVHKLIKLKKILIFIFVIFIVIILLIGPQLINIL